MTKVEAVPAGSNTRGVRRARLYLSRVDPWSVMKTSFVLSLGLAVVVMVATVLFWLLLTLSGTIDAVDQMLKDVGGQSSSVLDIGELFSFSKVLGFALLLAAFEITLTCALSTVIAAIYNITVGFTGGVELTLSEDQ